jgi:hypothetical protein
VAARLADPAKSLADILGDASRVVLGEPLSYSQEAMERILSPRHFVMIRRTWGGPAPDETRRAAAVSRQKLSDDEGWLAASLDALKASQTRLCERAAAL